MAVTFSIYVIPSERSAFHSARDDREFSNIIVIDISRIFL